MPTIMSYDMWMRRTRRGVTRPRSEELRAVDYALRNYSNAPSSATYGLLASAMDMWKATKEDPERSIRNTDGAVTELIQGIAQQKTTGASTPAPKTAPASAVSNAPKSAAAPVPMPTSQSGLVATPVAAVPVAAPSSGAAPVAGAIAAASASPVQIKRALGLVKDPDHANVSWENFPSDKIKDLSIAFKRALTAAERASECLRIVSEGRPGMATNLYREWFGVVDSTAMPAMIHSANLMVVAMKSRPITFVLTDPKGRPDLDDAFGFVHTAGGDFSHGPKVLPPHLEKTVGMGPELTAGGTHVPHHHTGTGMRIYMGNRVLSRVRSDECSTQSIYHELTHKVIATTDLGDTGNGAFGTIYGRAACKQLAAQHPWQARQLADCWGFYAIAQLKPWS